MGVDQFSSTLDTLIGFNVNLYVGEQVYKGKLIGVESDHVIIENENNYIFYYNINQIQAITKNTKQFQGEETTAEYLKTQSLREVLDSLTNSWVTIFCISKQKFTGILTNIGSDYITLINGAEGILIQITNIANVIKGELKEQEENSESNKEENQAEANAAELSYASPVLMEEEIVTRQDTVETSFVEPEHKQEAVAVPEPEQPKAVWSQPIKNTIEARIEMAQEKTEVKQEEEPQDVLTLAIEEPSVEPVEFQYQDVPSVKIIKEEIKQPGKVWSQSIKHNTEKLNDSVTKKMNNELKKLREEQVQSPKKQESKKEKVVNSSKKEEYKKPAKEVKEVKATQKQEITKKVHKEASLENKSEPKQQEQPVRTFRFLGEPIASRENDRPSIFDGWFSRTKDSRL